MRKDDNAIAMDFGWIRPQQLKKGDTVAVLSMSWGGPSVFPHVYEAGKKYLVDTLGLVVKEYWSTRAPEADLALHPERRAQDVMDAFRDPNVKAIFSSIGGDDSMLLLPHLDFAEIRRNPKIVMGYSDTTTLLTALAAHKVVSLHGPGVMAGFAQAASMPALWHSHIRDVLFGEGPRKLSLPSYAEFGDGYRDWSDTSGASTVKEWKKTDGWHWLHGDRKVSGRVLGGCVEVLEFLKGTEYWPKKQIWKNAILLLETSEEKPSVDVVKRVLRNYGLQGILSGISGLVVGRARDYSDEEKKQLDDTVYDVVVREFGCKDMVIVTNFDVGHTDPQVILPIGGKILLDSAKKTVTLLR